MQFESDLDIPKTFQNKLHNEEVVHVVLNDIYFLLHTHIHRYTHTNIHSQAIHIRHVKKMRQWVRSQFRCQKPNVHSFSFSIFP